MPIPIDPFEEKTTQNSTLIVAVGPEMICEGTVWTDNGTEKVHCTYARYEQPLDREHGFNFRSVFTALLPGTVLLLAEASEFPVEW